MAPSLEEIVLSWRTLPTPTEILTRIQTFLLNIDANGEETIQIADTTAANAVRWLDVTNADVTHLILVRYSQPVMRQLPASRVSDSHSRPFGLLMHQQTAIARIIVLLSYLVRVITALEAIEDRQVVYTVLPGIKANVLRTLIDP